MKNIIAILAVLLASLPAIGQHAALPKLWSRQEVQAGFGHNYEGMPVYRVYEYSDKDGRWNIVLCENHAAINGKDTTNTRIRAVALLNGHGGYLNKWAINDVIGKMEGDHERHIWFWSKYCSFTDLDNDGYADPVIVYGTQNEDREVRRVKLIIIHKGKKYPVRAVECVLDDCRHLTYDPGFKTLPQLLRNKVEAIMERMRKEQQVLLKEG